MAALAGSWTAVALGLGEMGLCHGVLGFAPPQSLALTRLAFTVVSGGRRLRLKQPVRPSPARSRAAGLRSRSGTAASVSWCPLAA